MPSIDERVVSLRLDSAQFQSAVRTTIEYMNKLKTSLKIGGAASEFDKVEKAAKNVSFNDLFYAVDSISDRFSTFGIIGMTALSNITTAAMKTGQTLISKILDPLVSGGKRRALNIEQAKFQIQGLGYAWEDVAGDINYAVDGTAYGLDVAARAASQLLASDIAIGDSMKKALRGISGVAAMTNSEYEDISRVFTTVAGNGRLMAEQLNQISARGINAAAALGKYLGVSEAEVRDMTSKGKIDFATFAAAMDDAFGEHAKKANDTFTGALSNMKAALSRIGAEIATPSYEALRKIFLSLTQVINGVKDSLGPLFNTFTKGSEIVSNFVETLLPFTTDNATRKSIAKALEAPMEQVNRIMIAVASSLTNIAKIISSIVGPALESFGRVLGVKILSILADALEVFEHFTSQLVFTDKMTENVRNTFNGIFTIISSVLTVISKLVGLIAQPLLSAVAKTFGLFADIVLSITGNIGVLVVKAHDFIVELSKLNTIQSILSAFRTALSAVREGLYIVYNAVRNLAVALIDNAFVGATAIFSGLAKVIGFVASSLDKAITAIVDFVSYIWQLPLVQTFITTISSSFKGFIDVVGDAASILKDKFIDAFNNAKRVIGNFVRSLKDLIEQYVKLPTFQEMVENLQNFITKAFEKSQDIFKKVVEVVGDIFDRVKEINEVSFKTIITNFTKLKDAIRDAIAAAKPLDTIANIFFGVKDGVSTSVQGIGSALGVAKDQLADFVSWVKEKFANVSTGDVIASGVGIMAIPFLYNLTRLTSALTQATSTVAAGLISVKKISDSIAGLMSSMKKVVKAKANSMYMQALSDIIKSIALLGGAVALLAAMNPQNVITSAAALGILAGAMVITIGVVNKLAAGTDTKTTIKAIGSMTSVAFSMLMLAIALNKVGEMPIEKMIVGVVGMGIVLAELAAFTIALDKFAPGMEKSTISFLGIAMAMVLMSKALSRLATIDLGGMITSVVAIGLIIKFLTIAGTIDGTAAEETALNLMGVAAGLLLMVVALKLIAGMKIGDLVKSVTVLITLVGMIVILLQAMAYTGEFAAKGGGAMILVGIAMGVMVISLKKMAELDTMTLNKATDALTRIMIIFSLLIAATSLAGAHAHKAGAAILAMSFSMIILSASIAILSKLDAEGLDRAVSAVQGIMLMFAIIIGATSVIESADKTLTLITITIGTLAAALAILSLIDPTNLQTASIALTSLMGMFAIMIASTGYVQKSYGTIGLMTLVFGAFAGALYMLAQLPMNDVLGISLGLSALILSMSTSMLLLSLITPLASGALPAIASLAVAILAISAVLVLIGGLIAQIDGAQDFINNAIPILESIGTAVGTFFGSIVGGFVGAASNGLTTLGQNLESFGKSFASFINSIKGIDEGAQQGVDSLIGLIVALTTSDLINKISGFMPGNATDIPNKLKQVLPPMAEIMKDFGDRMEDVNLESLSTSAEAAKYLMEMLNMMPTQGGIFKMFTGEVDIGEFSNQLPKFGQALKDYANTVNGISNDDIVSINNSTDAARGVVDLLNTLPNTSGGLAGMLGGFSDIGDFSDKIVGFGSAMVQYSNTVSENGAINAEGIRTSVDSARSLVDIAGVLSEMDINSPWWTGQGNKFEAFSIGIVAFGNAIVDYSNVVAQLRGFMAINNSVEPAKKLVEVSKIISELDINSPWWTGQGNKLEAFGTGIGAIGRALYIYSNALEGNGVGESTGGPVNNSLISNSIEGAKGLAEVAGLLNNVDLGGIFGGNTMSKFADGIADFGRGLYSYSEVLSGVQFDLINASIDGATSIVSVYSTLASTEQDLSQDTLDLIPNIATAFKEYCDIISGVSFDSVTASVTALESLKNAAVSFSEINMEPFDMFANALMNLGSSTVTNLANSLASQAPAAAAAGVYVVKQISDSMTTEFNNISVIIEDLAISLMNNVGKGFRTGESAVKTEFNSVINGILRSGADYVAKFNYLGRSFAEGAAKGVGENSYLLGNAVARMVNDAYDKGKQASETRSPSRKYMRLTAWWVEGAVIGINRNSHRLADSISNTTEIAMETFKTTLNRLSDGMFDFATLNPVITPVLDTSQVQAGMHQLESSLSTMDAYVALTQSLSNRSFSMANINPAGYVDANQNGSTVINNYDFVQNNSSPKALSSVDIYRQTNRQIKRFETLQRSGAL